MVPYIPDCMDGDVGTISKERLEKVEHLERYVNGEAEQLASLSAADSTSNSTTIPPEAESFADVLTKKP